MFGSNALETAIGLVVVFCILSLVATSLREMIELRLQSRAANLERGIRELLNDKDGTQIAKDVYNHPLISGLYRGTYDPDNQLKARPQRSGFLAWIEALLRGRKRRGDEWKRIGRGTNLPAYIPKRNMALALMDIAGRGKEPKAGAATTALTVESMRAGITNLKNAHLERVILVALDDAGADLEKARVNVERWFDASMDRVSGWYRKETQVILFVIGFLLAWIVNVDALQIARTLYQNSDMRAIIVAEAQATVDRAKDGGSDVAQLVCKPAAESTLPEAAQVSCAQSRLSKLGLPIGWKGWTVRWKPADMTKARDYWAWASSVPLGYVPGWLITAFAISLGAPFWFDLLNKMMVIRSTVKPHEKSPEESSEDRQTKPDKGATITLKTTP